MELTELVKAACELLCDWSLCPDSTGKFKEWFQRQTWPIISTELEPFISEGKSPIQAAQLIYLAHR